MAALKRLGAVYLIGVAVAMALYFIINPWHAESYDPGNIWGVLDILMVIALPLALDVNFRFKRTVDGRDSGEGITRRYLEANVVFYTTAALAILFLHNWFSTLVFGAELDNHRVWIIWATLNTLLPLALGVTGCRLWREASES